MPLDVTTADPNRCRCVRALRSGNGRRVSYKRCAARATQAIPGAPACVLELMGGWAPPEHQETPVDATRADPNGLGCLPGAPYRRSVARRTCTCTVSQQLHQIAWGLLHDDSIFIGNLKVCWEASGPLIQKFRFLPPPCLTELLLL